MAFQCPRHFYRAGGIHVGSDNRNTVVGFAGMVKDEFPV
jgi:hypothetical protein